jgi:hypothetical protein
MQFPFTYTGEIVFYKPNDFSFDLFVNQIESAFALSTKVKGELEFLAPLSYSKLPIKISLSLIDDKVSIHCKYRISLFESNVIVLLSWVFAFFFNHFNNLATAIFTLILGLGFYFFNTIKISNSIKRIIYNLIGGNPDIGKPELWKNQQEWMKDKNRCPACGEYKNAYSASCINCGLHLQNTKEDIKKINTSGSNDGDIVYEITKKKK